MGTAARIRNRRICAGKSQADAAKHLGINDAWYGDLERSDDELASTLTLFQAIELASFLGTSLRDLVGETDPPHEPVSLLDLPSRITAHVARNGESIEQFEDEVGWEIRDFLQSPLQVAAESPVMFLQAVAAPLGVDWLSLVPIDDSA